MAYLEQGTASFTALKWFGTVTGVIGAGTCAVAYGILSAHSASELKKRLPVPGAAPSSPQLVYHQIWYQGEPPPRYDDMRASCDYVNLKKCPAQVGAILAILGPNARIPEPRHFVHNWKYDVRRCADLQSESLGAKFKRRSGSDCGYGWKVFQR